jgi:hypothetical protein
MTITFITLTGLSAIILGLLWWRQIQISRENDKDFEIRDLAKEDIPQNENIF